MGKHLFSRIQKSETAKKIQNYIKTKDNEIVKFIALSIVWVVGLIPTWLYFFARWLIDPIGFWQELAIFVLFAFLLGWFQVILLIVLAVMSLAIILDDSY